MPTPAETRLEAAYAHAVDVQSRSDVGLLPPDPASPESIDHLRAFFGYALPEEYLYFLRRWGSWSGGPVEIFGIFKSDTGEFSSETALAETKNLREGWGGPDYLLVIHDLGNGDYACIDCRRVEEGEAPVVCWIHDEEPEEEGKHLFYASSFSEYAATKLVEGVNWLEQANKDNPA